MKSPTDIDTLAPKWAKTNAVTMLTKFVSLIDAGLVLEGLVLHKLGCKTRIFKRNISKTYEQYIAKPHHKGAVISDIIYDIILPFSRNIYRFPPSRSIWRLHRKINFKIIGDVEALPSYHALFYKSLLFRRLLKYAYLPHGTLYSLLFY